jgi:uncharacterized protein with HEPN domain
MNRDLSSVVDIFDAADFIAKALQGMSLQAFIDNPEKQFAVQHQLIVIGEAVKRLSIEFRTRHNQIEWT